jgi:hypothetical protein
LAPRPPAHNNSPLGTECTQRRLLHYRSQLRTQLVLMRAWDKCILEDSLCTRLILLEHKYLLHILAAFRCRVGRNKWLDRRCTHWLRRHCSILLCIPALWSIVLGSNFQRCNLCKLMIQVCYMYLRGIRSVLLSVLGSKSLLGSSYKTILLLN